MFLIALATVSLTLLFFKKMNHKKNKWGINVKNISCPSCGNEFNKIRKPKSMRQALWGGSTCDKCGVEVDKWGKRVNEK